MAEELTKETIQKRIGRDKPVVIDFYGSWCAPCKLFAPTFEKVSNGFKDIDFAKYDVDKDDGVLAAKLEIRSVPCTIIFNNGKEIGRMFGKMGEDELRERIREALRNGIKR